MSGLFTEKKWYLVSPNADGNWDQVTTAWGVNKSIFYRYIYELKEGVAHDTTLTEESWTQIDVISNPNLKTNTGYFVYVENPAIVPEPEPEPEPESEPEPEATAASTSDIEIKLEYTTGDVWPGPFPDTINGQDMTDAGGKAATTENMVIISARSLDGTDKTITGFAFAMSVLASSDSETTYDNFQKESWNSGWVKFSKLADWNLTKNLIGKGDATQGLLLGYTDDVAQYETLTSDFKTLVRIKYDNSAVTLDSVTLTSDTQGVNWTVSIV